MIPRHNLNQRHSNIHTLAVTLLHPSCSVPPHPYIRYLRGLGTAPSPKIVPLIRVPIDPYISDRLQDNIPLLFVLIHHVADVVVDVPVLRTPCPSSIGPRGECASGMMELWKFSCEIGHKLENIHARACTRTQ